MSVKRGLVVYPYVPHYRRGLYELLDSSDRFEFYHAAGPESPNGIKTLGAGELKSFIPLRNLYVRGYLWQFGLFKALRLVKPDFVIVLADMHFLSTTVLALWLKMRGVPIYFWTHGWTDHSRGFRGRLRLLYFSLADKLLLYGNVGKEFGLEAGYPEDKMSVIYNSVLSGAGVPASSLEGGSELSRQLRDFAAIQGPLVGAVARLREAKSLHLVIEAASRVRKKCPEYAQLGVVFVGDGPAREGLEDLAKELGVPLLLPGATYHDADIAEFYRHVAVSVMPDKVGLTGIQSLSFGVPVVSNGDPVGQMPEWEAIRPGLTGEYFTPHDVDSLAEAILQTLRSPTLADACIEEYQTRWSPSSQAEVIKSFLSSQFPAP